ncbi:SDR family NAD(P)-dependent oxidoreductase, partial [Marinitenerispora sediminis]
LITGATQGIGLAIATTLATTHRILICARDPDRLTHTRDQLTTHGHHAHAHPCDVRDPDQITHLIATTTHHHGPISVLVNNAGRSGGGTTRDIPDDLWNDVIDTNLTSVFRVTREVLKNGGILDQPTGRIINIASTGGKQGVVLGAPYSASKHGVIGFTKALGLELAKTGVTVNAVCPGYVETPMARKVRQNYAAHWGTTETDVLHRFQNKIPLGRYTTPDEVAAMVAYLASDAAAPVTAQAINICGGLGNY